MAHPLEHPTHSQGGPLPDTWPAQATETVVSVVGQVRDRTTAPAITAARAVVYGLFAAIVGVTALVLLIVFAVRLGNNYIPGRVWIIYVALGALFALAGILLWAKAFASPATDT